MTNRRDERRRGTERKERDERREGGNESRVRGEEKSSGKVTGCRRGRKRTLENGLRAKES